MSEDKDEFKLKPGKARVFIGPVGNTSHDLAFYSGALYDIGHSLNEIKDAPELPEHSKSELKIVENKIDDLREHMDQEMSVVKEGQNKVILTVNEGFEKSTRFSILKIIFETAIKKTVEFLVALTILALLAPFGLLWVLEYIGLV